MLGKFYSQTKLINGNWKENCFCKLTVVLSNDTVVDIMSWRSVYKNLCNVYIAQYYTNVQLHLWTYFTLITPWRKPRHFSAFLYLISDNLNFDTINTRENNSTLGQVDTAEDLSKWCDKGGAKFTWGCKKWKYLMICQVQRIFDIDRYGK